MSENSRPLDFEMIEDAMQRVSPHINKTPCVSSLSLSKASDCQLFLKLENLQRTGSFKERGALNALSCLTQAEREKGVIAASAGNHAQGVAFHARRLGIKATICMPESTPLIKIQRTQSFGAEIILHGNGLGEAYLRAKELEAEEGKAFIHPYNDPLVMAGQGTIALEMLRQNPWIEVYVVPIGGGGLISGMAMALKETNPRIKVIGVEIEAMASMKASIDAGKIVKIPPAHTIADGIAVGEAGNHTFDVVQRYVDDIVTVNDEQTAAAILRLLEQEKTVVEAASAVTVAALLAGKIPQARGRRVCALISGGNIDVNIISRIIERGLVEAGRRMLISINIPDSPGEMARLTSLCEKLRVNIIESHHDRSFCLAPFGETRVQLTLETRGRQQIREVQESFHNLGYKVVHCVPPSPFGSC